MTTPTYPTNMVNIAQLRKEAMALLTASNNKQVTQCERAVIGILIARAYKDPQHALLNAVSSDLLDHELPKFTALLCWLAPYSLVTEYTKAITMIALYLLGHTTEEVHKTINWDALHAEYPQLVKHS